MPGKVTAVIKSYTGQIINKVDIAMDQALNDMAIDGERLSKMQVPHDKGPLESSGRHQRLGFKSWRVAFNKEYAEVQHENTKFKHPKGRKAHYLSDPMETIAKNQTGYFQRRGGEVTKKV